ncbi:unnamed protein product [Caenorhabditis bovis]|uniref:Sex-determining protein fem-1 n=1 Tax=Caenorhabditis bovis TaxID=2654633 RepID=A0A8S1F571_9PELO|nr:unnamed protein product [Caenorhabditis bovis]
MSYTIKGQQFRMVVYNAAACGKLQRIKIFVEPNKDDPKWLNDLLNDDFVPTFPLVIAARNGHIDVVRYFLSLGASTSVQGCVEFDNDDILGAPPLWAAAAAGYFDVVKVLVEEANADVNQTTQTESTPLRGACYDGHLEIVKYLLDHGADINKPNKHGHTSLMIAAYRQKVDVVRLLLERGADVDVQTTRGNSALHDAAESGNVEIVKLLLERGAKIRKDSQGVCPLLCAAASGHQEVVEILEQITTNNLLRRDAYKLLGCTFVDKKMDNYLALSFWRTSVDIELTHEEWQEISAWEATTEPLDVYDYSREFHRCGELMAIEGNLEALRMQSLVIRERILGEAHPDVHYYLRFRGAVCCDLGQMDKCYTLWKRALEMQQKHFQPFHGATVTTLMSFQETFGLALNDYVNAMHADRSLRVSSSWIQYVFERICIELERFFVYDKPLYDESCGSEKCSSESIESDKKKLCTVALQLINIMERISLPSANGDDIDDKGADLDIQRLVNICDKIHASLLHYALEETSDEHAAADYMSLPKASVLMKLIEQNVDTSAVDSNGNSPIHVLLKSNSFRRSLIRILLEHGALLFACNKKNEVVYTKLREVMKTTDIPLGRFITLKGLAAHAFKRKYNQNLPADEYPAHLLNFMEKH